MIYLFFINYFLDIREKKKKNQRSLSITFDSVEQKK